MVNQMVWNNLMFRKTRTALSVLAVALEVLLILSTVGMVAGIVNEQASRTRGIGARIYVPLETTQDLNSSKDKASIFYVRVDDPLKNTDQVKAIIESPDLLKGYSVLSMDELTSLITTMEGYPIRPFKLVMTGI